MILGLKSLNAQNLLTVFPLIRNILFIFLLEESAQVGYSRFQLTGMIEWGKTENPNPPPPRRVYNMLN